MKLTFKQFIKAVATENRLRDKPISVGLYAYRNAHHTIYSFSPWLYHRLWRWI